MYRKQERPHHGSSGEPETLEKQRERGNRQDSRDEAREADDRLAELKARGSRDCAPGFQTGLGEDGLELVVGWLPIVPESHFPGRFFELEFAIGIVPGTDPARRDADSNLRRPKGFVECVERPRRPLEPWRQ